jgi:hypothetical protein
MRWWAIGYIALVFIAENVLRFDAYGGVIIGHVVTFLLFLLILTVLARQWKDGFSRVKLAETHLEPSLT